MYGCDPPNHGFSVIKEENRGFIKNFNDYMRLGRAMAYYRLWSHPHKDNPTFLVGHSLGALVVLRLLQLKIPLNKNICGAICLSTPLKVDHNVSEWVRVARPVLEFFDPYLAGRRFWDRIPVDYPDDLTIENFSEDKNFYKGPLFLRTAREIHKTATVVRKEMEKVDVPILFIHGAQDDISPLSEIENAVKELPASNATLHTLRECGHYLNFDAENSPINKQMTPFLLEWLEAKLGDFQKHA